MGGFLPPLRLLDAHPDPQHQERGQNVFKFEPGFNFNPSAEERMRKPMSYEDAVAIDEECPSVLEVTALMSPVDFMQGPMADRVKIRCPSSNVSVTDPDRRPISSANRFPRSDVVRHRLDMVPPLQIRCQ